MREKKEIIKTDLFLHTKSSIYETLHADNFMLTNLIKVLENTKEKEERKKFLKKQKEKANNIMKSDKLVEKAVLQEANMDRIQQYENYYFQNTFGEFYKKFKDFIREPVITEVVNNQNRITCNFLRIIRHQNVPPRVFR